MVYKPGLLFIKHTFFNLIVGFMAGQNVYLSDSPLPELLLPEFEPPLLFLTM